MPLSAFKTRVAQGLCGAYNCPEKPIPGRSLCPVHTEKSRLQAAAQRAKRAAAGRCRVPGCPKLAAPNRTRCKEHLAQSVIWQQAKVAKWKAAGLCIKDGKDPAKPGCFHCQKHIDEMSAYALEQYYARKAAGTTCVYCPRPRDGDRRTCLYHTEYARNYRAEVKLDVLRHYSGLEVPACALCGKTDLDVLVIDHINGGGCQHRKDIGIKGGGHGFYQWLRRNGYPPGFRVLCNECNWKEWRRLQRAGQLPPDAVPPESPVDDEDAAIDDEELIILATDEEEIDHD